MYALSPPISVLPSGFRTEILYTFLLSPVHTPPLSSSWSDCSNIIWWGQTIKLLTLNFSSASFYFLSFRLKFSTAACSWMPSVNIFPPHEGQSFTLIQNNRWKYRFVHLNLCFQIADVKKKYSEQNCLLLVKTAWHKHKFVSWWSNDVTSYIVLKLCTVTHLYRIRSFHQVNLLWNVNNKLTAAWNLHLAVNLVLITCKLLELC